VLGAQARDGLAVRELPRSDTPGTQRRPGDALAGGKQASKLLSTIVVTVTSSDSGSVTGSAAGPSAARGADHAASAAECS